MAMAFAPFALINHIIIEEPEVVNKSYPGFWEEVGKLTALGLSKKSD
jgi:3-phosphoshikimate 1-carboxyvinyltransferase